MQKSLTGIDHDMGTRHPLRILLTEDNAVNQKVAMHILKRLGYEADLARNGQEAVDAVQQKQYDVILMDISMPVMDGVTATLQIREILPAEQQPHIVAVTAHALVDEKARYLAAGMNDFVPKPVSIEVFRRLLAACQPLGSAPNAQHQATSDEIKIEIDWNRAPLDPDMWESLVEIMEEAMPDLIETYINDSRRIVNEIREALSEQKWQEIAMLTHTLKGNSNAMAAVVVGELAQKIESLLLASPLDEEAITAHVKGLSRAHQQLVTILQSY